MSVRVSRRCSPEQCQPVNAPPTLGDRTDVTTMGWQGCPPYVESRGLVPVVKPKAAPLAGACECAWLRSAAPPLTMPVRDDGSPVVNVPAAEKDHSAQVSSAVTWW